MSPSGEIVEGSSVTLTCSSDANPAATHTWYKENQQLLQGPGNYHFTSISSEDRGTYYCKSENQYGRVMSSSLSIDVKCKFKFHQNVKAIICMRAGLEWQCEHVDVYQIMFTMTTILATGVSVYTVGSYCDLSSRDHEHIIKQSEDYALFPNIC